MPTEKERLSIVETDVKYIKSDVKSIKRDVKLILVNHLPHIQADIQKHKWQMGIIVGIASMIGSVVFGRLIDKLL